MAKHLPLDQILAGIEAIRQDVQNSRTATALHTIAQAQAAPTAGQAFDAHFNFAPPSKKTAKEFAQSKQHHQDWLHKALNYIDMPRAAVVAAYQEGQNLYHNLHKGSNPNDVTTKPVSWSDFLKHFHEHESFGQVVKNGNDPGGIDKNTVVQHIAGGGKVGPVPIPGAGDIALDPLTYLLGPGKALEGGSKEVAQRIADSGVEGADQVAAKVAQKGASSLTREESLKYLGETGGLKVAGQTAIPQEVTHLLTRPLGEARAAVRGSALGDVLSHLSGTSDVNRLLNKEITSGEADRALPALETQRQLATANAGARVLDRKLAQAWQKVAKTIKGNEADAVAAVEGDAEAASRLAAKGVDTAPLKDFIHTLYQHGANAGLNIRELQDYFPRQITQEAKDALKASGDFARNGGKAAFEKGRNITAGADLGGATLEGSNAAIRRQAEAYLKDAYGLKGDFFEKNPHTVIPYYINALTRRIGRKNLENALVDAGIAKPAVEEAFQAASKKDVAAAAKAQDQAAQLEGRAGKAAAKGAAAREARNAEALAGLGAGDTQELGARLADIAAQVSGHQAQAAPDVADTLARLLDAQQAARGLQGAQVDPALAEAARAAEQRLQGVAEGVAPRGAQDTERQLLIAHDQLYADPIRSQVWGRGDLAEIGDYMDQLERTAQRAGSQKALDAVQAADQAIARGDFSGAQQQAEAALTAIHDAVTGTTLGQRSAEQVLNPAMFEGIDSVPRHFDQAAADQYLADQGITAPGGGAGSMPTDPNSLLRTVAEIATREHPDWLNMAPQEVLGQILQHYGSVEAFLASHGVTDAGLGAGIVGASSTDVLATPERLQALQDQLAQTTGGAARDRLQAQIDAMQGQLGGAPDQGAAAAGNVAGEPAATTPPPSAYPEWAQQAFASGKLPRDMLNEALAASDSANAALADAQGALQSAQQEAEKNLTSLQQQLADESLRPTKRAALARQAEAQQRAATLYAAAQAERDPVLRRVATLEAKASDAEARVGDLLDKAAAKRQTVDRLLEPRLVRSSIDELNTGAMKLLSPDVAAPADIADALNRIGKVTDPNGFRRFVRYYDKAFQYVKAFELASPGTAARHSMGAFFNNYLADVRMSSYVGFMRDVRAFRAGRLEGDALDRFTQIDNYLVRNGQVSAQELTHGGGSHGVLSAINPLSQNNLAIRGVHAGIGESEYVTRGALMYDVLKKGGSIDDAVAAVNKFHFDYADLSQFEKGVVKRVIPFYTWTRKNLGLQLQMMADKPGKFFRYFNIKNQIERQSPQEKYLASYVGESPFSIRLPNRVSGGNVYLTPHLPFTDPLTAFLPLTAEYKFDPTRPLQNASPLIKTPIERAMNHQFFADIPFNDKEQPVPGAWGSIPGLMPALGALGQARKQDGKWVMKDREAYTVEQLLPILARMRRQAPSEKRYQQRALTTWLGFIGLPVYSNNQAQQDAQKKREEFTKLKQRVSYIPKGANPKDYITIPKKPKKSNGPH